MCGPQGVVDREGGRGEGPAALPSIRECPLLSEALPQHVIFYREQCSRSKLLPLLFRLREAYNTLNFPGKL